MKDAQVSIQDTLLNQLRKQKTPIVMHLMNGFQIKNALIVGFDSFVVLLLAEGKQMMIYKHAISSVTMPEGVVWEKGNADVE